MALGWLFFTFIGMAVFSLVGLAFLFLSKRPGVKNAFFYIMAIWGLFVGYMGATALPGNFVLQQYVCWAVGALGIIAILVKHLGKRANASKLAYGLVALSVVAGMCLLFF